MKRYGKVHVDDEMVLASMQAQEDEAFMTLSEQMQRLGDEVGRKLFGCRTCKRQPARGYGQCAICLTGHKEPVVVTSRRIRRNALRELKRRLRWGRGKSFAEALRTMDVARVSADKRVGEPEMALLYATQGWRP